MTHEPPGTFAAEGRRLLATADETGLAPLPSLRLLDLCVYDAHRHVVVDEGAATTWIRLDPSIRDRLSVEAVTALRARGLVREQPARSYRADARPVCRAHPALAMIVGARRLPTWLAVGSVTDAPTVGPRVYGLGNAERPFRAAVVEVPRGPLPADPGTPSLDHLARVYDYALASTAAATDFLAEWVTQGSAAPGSEVTGQRVVDVYHHQPGQPLSRARVSVDPAVYQRRMIADANGQRNEVAVLLERAVRRYASEA